MAKRATDKHRGGSLPDEVRTVYTLSDDETHELGRAIGRNLTGGELLLLEGELGIGKTVFARGIAAGLGIAPQDVSSPSFTLVQEYRGGRIPMTHVDLYRLEGDQEIATLGLEEVFATTAVTVVEWAERLPARFRTNGVTVRFHDLARGARRIEILDIDGSADPARSR